MSRFIHPWHRSPRIGGSVNQREVEGNLWINVVLLEL
jgi:hypothetical protein